MASTNQTIHYDLSQYVANDKPTYLVDYNGDMNKIDTAIYGADSRSLVNESAIGDLTELDTTAKNNLVSAINEVNTQVGTNTGDISELNTDVSANTGNIGTMANLETTDKTSLVNAINEVKSIINNFNLTSFSTLTGITGTNITVGTNDVKLAKNSDGSLAKVYGTIAGTVTGTGSKDVTITIPNSGLAPQSDITINCAGIVRISNSAYSPSQVDLTIKTNGTIEVNKLLNGGDSVLIILLPFLYFVKDFGDTPTPTI